MNKMKHTRTATIELHPAGCIIVRALGIVQTVEDARENVEVSVDLSGGVRKRPLLVDITKTAPLLPETRHYYADGALADNFTVLGLLVEDSPLGRMIGDVFFRMMDKFYSAEHQEGIKTRVFINEQLAIDWLTSQDK